MSKRQNRIKTEPTFDRIHEGMPISWSLVPQSRSMPKSKTSHTSIHLPRIKEPIDLTEQ